jgi:hypothetical protein
VRYIKRLAIGSNWCTGRVEIVLSIVLHRCLGCPDSTAHAVVYDSAFMHLFTPACSSRYSSVSNKAFVRPTGVMPISSKRYETIRDGGPHGALEKFPSVRLPKCWEQSIQSLVSTWMGAGYLNTTRGRAESPRRPLAGVQNILSLATHNHKYKVLTISLRFCRRTKIYTSLKISWHYISSLQPV